MKAGVREKPINKTLPRNLDNAARDYSDHLGEIERKIIQIVDAALQQQLVRCAMCLDVVL